MFLPPRTTGGPQGGGYTLPIHFNSHHPIVSPTFWPYSGEPHASPSKFSIPLAPQPVDSTPSLSTYTYQPNGQANIPRSSQSSLEGLSDFSRNTALPPQPGTTLDTPKPPLPTPLPFSRNETRPKKTQIATDVCPFPQCNEQKFGRVQDLKRHVLQHLLHYIYCSQPGCSWTGNRLYALRDHLKKKHEGAPFPKEHRMFIIYDAKRLVKQLLNRAVTVAQAESEASMSHQNKAMQLGKLGSWRVL